MKRRRCLRFYDCPLFHYFFPCDRKDKKKKKQSNPQMKKFQILHNCRKINPLIQATKKVLVSVTLYFRSSCFWFRVGFAFHLIKPRFPGSVKVNARFIKRLSSKKNFNLLWTRGTKAHETQQSMSSALLKNIIYNTVIQVTILIKKNIWNESDVFTHFHDWVIMTC